MDLEGWSLRLKVFADATRVRLLALLEREELTVAELSAITRLAQPRVSTHLAKLKEAGLSSQGSDSFAVYDIKPPFAQRGTFVIGTHAALGIDGVSETDGLDLSVANLGGPYADGLLVVQDGHKRLPQGPQNFKLVPWRDVEKVLMR